jgi:ubiquinone/menaquinone biosynthesis C-methylase UbiE
MKPDFNRERAWWENKASGEELDAGDEPINRALRWREIERNLQGIRTIAEVGAAAGAFTVPLARRGYRVTHIDFSAPALELAKKKAGRTKNIDFVMANATNLKELNDRAFDLVLNMDGAISFCGKDAARSLRETCRICRKRLIVTVSNKAWMVPVWVSSTLLRFRKTVPAVNSMIESGFWHYDQHPHNKKIVPGYFGTLQAFLPEELSGLIKRQGFKIKSCRGIGSLANLCGKAFSDTIQKDKKLIKIFLDLCERYDREILPSGPGTRQRAGLMAIAERR